MKRSIELMLVATVVLLFGFAMSLPAQETLLPSPIKVSEGVKPTPVHYPSAPATLFIPKSSLVQTVPAGHKFAANTNVEVVIPAGVKPGQLPPFPASGWETPASLGCVYDLVGGSAGCNPQTSKGIPTGGANTIAVVDAYDDPAGPGDLAWFSLQFGLPLKLTQFNIVWANTSNSSCYPFDVPQDFSGGWELEESLDIEWAHAMAPKANIYLVEACSNLDTDLQQAVMVANNLVSCGITGIATDGSGTLTVCTTGTGKGEVSMSWGGLEFSDETGVALSDTTCIYPDDSCFTMPGVVYFASAGDSPGVQWPGTSPNVVSAGGLTNRRNPANFNWEQQTAWVKAGGGQSAYETQPSYQNSGPNYTTVQAVCGIAWRCVPDLSFDADPWTGVYVYDSFPIDGFTYYADSWVVVGGTSVSAPSLAGIINNAASRSGTWAASSNAELTTIYGNIGTDNLAPVAVGYCGAYMGLTAVSGGYNMCTGTGAVHGYGGE